jgi:hypothetical protein
MGAAPELRAEKQLGTLPCARGNGQRFSASRFSASILLTVSVLLDEPGHASAKMRGGPWGITLEMGVFSGRIPQMLTAEDNQL